MTVNESAPLKLLLTSLGGACCLPYRLFGLQDFENFLPPDVANYDVSGTRSACPNNVLTTLHWFTVLTMLIKSYNLLVINKLLVVAG